jgi:cytochrome c peroxidase
VFLIKDKVMKNYVIFLSVSFVVIFGISCGDKDNPEPLPDYDPTPLEIVIPDHMPILDIPAENPMTVEGVKLGRMLYYDNLLHQNEENACADCHIQSKSFTDGPDVLPHMNFGWYTNFLWNGKISGTLEDIMLFEVAEFFKTDLDKLNNHGDYPDLFYAAFGTQEATHELAAKALSQFERTLVCGNSRFDRVVYENSEFFTDEELLGYELFFTEEGDCFHCHGGVLFTDNLFHNNGLDEVFSNMGYGEITGEAVDMGRFKTPTLRNIELTAPYMHDGRYATLEEVVGFYSGGLKFSETIDPLMKNVHQGGVDLTDEEKSALVAFLKTLTDTSFINNPNFSNPF